MSFAVPTIRHLVPVVLLPLLAVIAGGCAAPGSDGPAQSASAQPPPIRAASFQSPDEAGAALAAAFAQLCLARFPERDDLAAGGAPQGTQLAPMPQEQVQRYLSEEPGRGWTYQTPAGDYVVTIEDPPYRTCAVRRMFTDVPRFNQPFQSVSRGWAAAEGRGQFHEGPPMQHARPDRRILGRTMLLPPAAGRPAEIFMEIATIYADGQVEVRFVRQIPDPALIGAIRT